MDERILRHFAEWALVMWRRFANFVVADRKGVERTWVRVHLFKGQMICLTNTVDFGY